VHKSQSGLLYPLILGDEVNFRLTYDGPLKAASQSETRRLEKHAIRCVFSQQLDQLFEVRSEVFDSEFSTWDGESTSPAIKRGKLTFFALVRARLNLVCDLDILFLRRDNPGNLITSGGDLDNRIKVLFDALRIPQDDNEVRDLVPAVPGMICCVTENDSLITGFRVTTDRLLEPPKSEAERNHVRLIINVEVKATKLTAENMAYFSHF
jgi:hypothetical protein